MSKRSKPKMSNLVLFLIPIGVAVNFIGGQIAILLKLPLYLDAIGTIFVGALTGYLPGIIVGVISNILNSISSPVILYYAPLSMGFAVVATYLSKRKVFNSLPKTLLSSVIYAFIGGGIGALITWGVYGFDFGAGASSMFSIPLHELLGFPKFLAVLVAEFTMDVFDKLLTVFSVFVILKSIPTRFLTKLPLGHIFIKDEDVDSEKILKDY